MSSESPSPQAMVAAVLAILLWGLGPVLVKSVEMPGLSVAFYRLSMGGALLTALLLARGGRLTWRSLRGAAPGGIAFAVNISFFFSAVKTTSVADATIIVALQPVILFLVVGPLFGESVSRSLTAWTTLAIGGVALVVYGSSGPGQTGSLAGDALALGALLTWAWYFVASKRARRHLGALEYQAGLLVVAACVLGPLALAARQSFTTDRGLDWLLILSVAVVPGTGHLLMNWAHGHIPLTAASLLTLGTPVIATATAAVFLGESLQWSQGLGMAIVLASLAVVVLRMGRPPAVITDEAGPVDSGHDLHPPGVGDRTGSPDESLTRPDYVEP